VGSTQGPATALLTRAMRAALPAQEGAGPLVLAVSGGADSLALAWAAIQVLPPQRLVVAHFSHGMRPAAQRREAALVRRAARDAGLALRHGEATAPPASEAAARAARYAFLAQVARAEGACAVATGHTRDDQAETVLLRLVRGTGLRGAAAMRARTHLPGAPDVPLLRPLLTVGRADTEAACAEAGWRHASDGTNRSLAYARNRVRRRVLPELERTHSGAARALARFAQAARSDDAALEALAAQAVDGGEERTATTVRWPRALLAGLHPALMSRVLEAAWRHLAGEEAALSSAKLAGAQRLLASLKGGGLDLGGGLRLVVEQDACTLAPMQRSAPQLTRARLAVPGQVTWGDWTLEAGFGEAPDGPGDAYAVRLDADAVGALLGVRARVAGERMEAAGHAGPVRVQDLLVNARVPRGERAGWPLVEAEGGLVWVPGVRAARWALAGPGTPRVLTLRAWKRPGLDR
jgi:tRNA(Ile)-lysidine synthetase-like protein